MSQTRMDIATLNQHLYRIADSLMIREVKTLISVLYLDPEREEHLVDLPGCYIAIYPY